MGSPPQPPAPEAVPARRRQWDALAAVIAALIGLLALLVSGYTAMLQREQVRAEVWPYLQPAISPSRQNASIENKGVGPAQVRSLKVYVDGVAQHDWPAVFDALGLGDLRDTPASTVSGIVIAPAETIQQLAFADETDFQRFYREYPRIQLALCYCSTLDECWMLDGRGRTPESRRGRVEACPARGADDFVDNELALPSGAQGD